MVKLFNTGFHLNEILNRIRTEKEVKIVPTLLIAGIVTVLSSGMHLFAISSMTVVYTMINADDKIVGIIFITFAIQAAIPASFYGMTLIAKLYFKKLNHSK